MNAKHYAAIKYYWITLKILPRVLWLAILATYYCYKKNDAKLLTIWSRVKHLEIDRRQETIRTYRYYKNGYELTIKI